MQIVDQHFVPVGRGRGCLKKLQKITCFLSGLFTSISRNGKLIQKNFKKKSLTNKKCDATIRLTTKEVMQLSAMQYASEVVLCTILVVAVVQDFMYTKISNRLILVGLILSLAFGIILGGMSRIPYILLNISFPVVVLYLLYLLGVLGAGDIKLFSVIGGFTNFTMLTHCMLAAFFAGGVIAVVKMLWNRNLNYSLIKGQLFLRQVLKGKVVSYRNTMAEKRNLMHFSVAILAGYILAGLYSFMRC